MRLPDAPPPLVLKYYLYQATVTFGFFWPVFTVFLLHRGLTYTQIGLLGTVSAAFVVLGEIPTGYVGDRIGRRNGLLVGSVLLSLSLLGFVVARGFVGFAVLYVLWALGLSFRSGTDDAWLYDALESRLREDEYTRVRGRGGSVNRWVSAGTMLVAGGLYAVRPWLPFLAGGLLVAGSIPVLLSMPRSRRADRADELTVREALPVIRRRLTEPPLRSFVLYVALFFGIVNAADTFIQPITTRTLGLPAAGLGPLYAGFTVVAAVASYHAATIEELLSTRWAVLLVPGLVAAFFVVPLLAPVAALPLFFAMKSARAVMAPIASGYLNDRVESAGRATLLSAASMVYALVRIPLKPLAGVVADATAPLVAVAALGGFFVLASVAVRAVETPVVGAESDRRTAD
ncbi:MFS transporter [Haladaptatus salinisoli]|uniref:MFS transporter n=1 Tax=Haladaptatus salinisoli TaxID=2884876 RepID=UPI001D0B2F8E|nr:MFS transporter [Haladaptatus salinisoli]